MNMDNSRKIAFRAWDSRLKMIFDVESHDWKNKVCWVIKPKGHSIIDPILMQYTGLKDKNGKEIYEGDIVCIVKDVVADVIGGYERTEPEGQFYTVEWKDASFFIGGEMLWEWATDCEVIGNIYENPELLKSN